MWDLPHVPIGLKREWLELETRRHFLGRGAKALGWAGLATILGRTAPNLLANSGAAVSPLAGMLAPRNLGEPYTRAFDAIYPELAAKHGLLLYPFFLDGVAMNAKLNLDDGLHPNSRGVAEITKKILPSVEQLIERARAKQAAGTKG